MLNATHLAPAQPLKSTEWEHDPAVICHKKLQSFRTLFLGLLLFIPHLIFSDLWPRGVLLILWQERLLPLEGQRSHLLDTATHLFDDTGPQSLHLINEETALSRGSIYRLLCLHPDTHTENDQCQNISRHNEGNERKVLPIADSSFSKGKTG